MRRITFGTVTLVSCVAVFAGFAVASPPLQTPLNITINREVTGICAFPIRIQGTQTGQQIDFFNADGRLVRRHRHGVEEVTLTANGQTLTRSVPLQHHRSLRPHRRGGARFSFRASVSRAAPRRNGISVRRQTGLHRSGRELCRHP
jgi:hypothetical protein